MKCCEVCGEEISTKDGDNRCAEHEETQRVSKKVRRKRIDRDAIMRDLGMTRVRGALGGTYYE